MKSYKQQLTCPQSQRVELCQLNEDCSNMFEQSIDNINFRLIEKHLAEKRLLQKMKKNLQSIDRLIFSYQIKKQLIEVNRLFCEKAFFQKSIDRLTQSIDDFKLIA